MPAPLVHMTFAQAYRERHRPELDERELLRGTVFPDVRRLAGIPREATHRKGVSLDDVARQTDAWWVGWWLHSYLDEAWNNFFVGQGLVVNPLMDEATWRALKTAEEIGVAERIEGRERLAKLFEGPLGSNELASESAPDATRRWYGFVAWLLREPYEPESWGRMMQAVGDSSAAEVEELLPLVEQFRQSTVWQGRLDKLHIDLEY